ncbi:MAG: hypothetical protein R6V20_03335 [Desulfobia sp.]
MKLQVINIRKIFKSGLLILFLLVFIYVLYIANKQDYRTLSPTGDLKRPAQKKPEKSEDGDYMDFINKPPIEPP